MTKKYNLLYTDKNGKKVDKQVTGNSAVDIADQHKNKADANGVTCWPVHIFRR